MLLYVHHNLHQSRNLFFIAFGVNTKQAAIGVVDSVGVDVSNQVLSRNRLAEKGVVGRKALHAVPLSDDGLVVMREVFKRRIWDFQENDMGFQEKDKGFQEKDKGFQENDMGFSRKFREIKMNSV